MAAHDRYREEADKFLKERDEMYRKATDAFNRKQRSVAAYYAQLVSFFLFFFSHFFSSIYGFLSAGII